MSVRSGQMVGGAKRYIHSQQPVGPQKDISKMYNN